MMESITYYHVSCELEMCELILLFMAMFKCELMCFVIFCVCLFFGGSFGEKEKNRSGKRKEQIHIVLLLSVDTKYIHQLKTSMLSSCAVVAG